MTDPALSLLVPCAGDYDLISSQRAIQLGPYDPTLRITEQEVWRATRSPQGPVTFHAHREPGGVRLSAWGPGAAWVAERAPALLGLEDEPGSFAPEHPLLRTLSRRHRGLHLPQTRSIFGCLVPTVLQQLVSWREAMRAYEGLMRRFGEPAPGPARLWLLPAPRRLARVPAYAMVPLGMLERHAETLRRAASRAVALERLLERSPAEARAGLESVRGIGPWTSAWVVAVAMGDPDAILLGDLHLPREVCFALAGERDGDDTRMVELLEPFAGHRWRVVTLLRRGAPRPPRRGPRRTLRRRPRRGGPGPR